jgi:hypothetical protein
LPWALDVLVIGGLTVAYVAFITRDRTADAISFYKPDSLAGLTTLSWRVIACVLAVLLYLLGWMLSIKGLWGSRREAATILTVGAAANCFLAIVLYIHGFGDEYKFMFAAAICLAPFASLALDPLIDRPRRRPLLVYAVLTLLLAIPLAYKNYRDWPWYEVEQLTTAPPALDLQQFDLKLATRGPLAALVEAIREDTPRDAIVLVERSDIYLPALTQRALYVAPAHAKRYPGVNINIADMLTIPKGYDRQIIDVRRQNLEMLFHSEDSNQVSQALTAVLALEQPVAIVLETSQHERLQNWLAGQELGRSVYDDGQQYALWLVEPGGEWEALTGEDPG